MTGVLLIDADAPSFDGQTAVVTIEDARRAGAPAVPIAELRIADVAHRRGVAGRVPFAIECAAHAHHSVRASIGRLHSTERVNVGADGAAVSVRVEAPRR